MAKMHLNLYKISRNLDILQRSNFSLILSASLFIEHNGLSTGCNGVNSIKQINV